MGWAGLGAYGLALLPAPVLLLLLICRNVGKQRHVPADSATTALCLACHGGLCPLKPRASRANPFSLGLVPEMRQEFNKGSGIINNRGCHEALEWDGSKSVLHLELQVCE